MIFLFLKVYQKVYFPVNFTVTEFPCSIMLSVDLPFRTSFACRRVKQCWAQLSSIYTKRYRWTEGRVRSKMHGADLLSDILTFVT